MSPMKYRVKDYIKQQIKEEIISGPHFRAKEIMKHENNSEIIDRAHETIPKNLENDRET